MLCSHLLNYIFVYPLLSQQIKTTRSIDLVEEIDIVEFVSDRFIDAPVLLNQDWNISLYVCTCQYPDFVRTSDNDERELDT